MEKTETSTQGGALHKAVTYTLKRWPALWVFVDDARVALDNNGCERAIRPVAMGRKAWLFAGSLRVGERMVPLMSLVETARMNDLDPWSRLRSLALYPEAASLRGVCRLCEHIPYA